MYGFVFQINNPSSGLQSENLRQNSPFRLAEWGGVVSIDVPALLSILLVTALEGLPEEWSRGSDCQFEVSLRDLLCMYRHAPFTWSATMPGFPPISFARWRYYRTFAPFK